MSDRVRIVIAAFTFVIAILLAGHAEWLNRDHEMKQQMKDLEAERRDLEKLLETCEVEKADYEIALQNQSEMLSDLAYKLSQKQDEILHYDYCGEFTITAYCCEKYPHICGGGNTASGVKPTPELTCAVCDLEMFPYGTVIYIEDVGIRVVQDTGGFDFSKIDVAVAKHDEAIKWKTGKHKVWILEMPKE